MHRRLKTRAAFHLPTLLPLSAKIAVPKTSTNCQIALAKAVKRAAAVAIVAASVSTAATACAALGVDNQLLTDCNPARVSCVSSQDDTPMSFLEPWEYDGNVQQIKSRLEKIVLNDRKAVLVQSEDRYLRFEIAASSNSSQMDDLEFYFPPDDNIVHFRGARRDEAFDFFQNRRRLDRIRQQAGLSQIAILRNRISPMVGFETPFDSFGPTAVDVDALIENRSVGSRPVR